MESDDQYTALGPTTVGFLTHGDFDRGGEMTGDEVGVKGIGGGADGEGVIGIGGTNQRTGVIGRGGGVGEPDGGAGGVGGIGVHGIGGFDPHPDSNKIPPGIGVVAEGGRLVTEFNNLRRPHGAGIVALAGGSGPGGKPVPPHTETGGVGVFGQGADAESKVTAVDPIDGHPILFGGPIAPGSGVLGRGGMPSGPGAHTVVAAGVIGLAGGTAIPPISETGENGVFGKGPTGVVGQGQSAGVRGRGQLGVVGISNELPSKGMPGADAAVDRGGQFQSAKQAQVELVPHHLKLDLPLPVPVTVTAIPVAEHEGLGQHFPADGHGGDLMTVIDSKGQSTLWFCVRHANPSLFPSGHAQWAQVLLGSPFTGQA